MSITTSERARSSAPPPPDVDAENHSPREFCLALKAARERRGITITAIAESTKVCPSHLVALERGDLQYWPKGLIRRAFFRGYVGMIGLPVDEMLNEFVRLFPDDPAALAARPESGTRTPRLALDESWHGTKAPFSSRLIAAVIDALVVILLPVPLAWFTGWNLYLTLAAASVSYFTIATLFLGTSPAAWILRHRSLLSRVWQRENVTTLLTRELPTIPEGFRVGEEDGWTTDAHRVRPRHVPPAIRVRFKWS